MALSKKFLAISKRRDASGKIVAKQGKLQHSELGKPMPGVNTGTLVIYETDRTILTESGSFMTDQEGLTRALNLVEYISAFKGNTKIEVYTHPSILPEKWFAEPADVQWNYIATLEAALLYKSPDDITPMTYVRSKFGITGKTLWDLELVKTINPRR